MLSQRPNTKINQKIARKYVFVHIKLYYIDKYTYLIKLYVYMHSIILNVCTIHMYNVYVKANRIINFKKRDGDRITLATLTLQRHINLQLPVYRDSYMFP